MYELKPCPKCKGKVAIFVPHGCMQGWYQFKCMGCELTDNKYYETESQAVVAWNTRPVEDELKDILPLCFGCYGQRQTANEVAGDDEVCIEHPDDCVLAEPCEEYLNSK